MNIIPLMRKQFAEIAVEVPVYSTFTYSIPAELENDAALGKRALVPFGRRLVTGYIVGLSCSPPPDLSGIKPVSDILDAAPIFDEKRLKFFRWMSSYYFAPLGEALSLIHPGSANLKSSRFFKAVRRPEDADGNGKGGKRDLRPLEAEVLEYSRKRVSVSALRKRFSGRPVLSAVERLKKKGLLTEEEGIRGGGTVKVEKFISVVTGAERPVFKNSPMQEKAYEHLSRTSGEVSLSLLTDTLGEAWDALKRLKEKGLVHISERQVLRDPLEGVAARTADFDPNPEQKAAIEKINEALNKGGYSPFLLYGVTGSGKTLVYLKALQEAVRLGMKAVILSPEIALTPWPAAYLRALFPGRVALAHSGLSEGERLDEWRRVANGDADIVVGARSALFSPLKDLGLIIVDEEHETSYKQEDGVRYNARDAAMMLAKHLGITVVLGSATPSLESFHNAKTGKLVPLVIRNRVDSRPLPTIEVLDMKGRKEVISGALSTLLKSTLDSGRQSLLFLNRRGFSSSLICRDCGLQYACTNCSVSLTLHKGRKRLVCHYCDLSVPAPDLCTSCSGTNLITPGAGTERVEEDVMALLPRARVARMDRDTASARGSARRIIEDVEEKRLDILIGTQMASKGHHFPGVTLVGVISGDTSLNIPDFRSSERTFQLITQAAGRAGRGTDPGHVVIQTLNPGHYCFSSIAAQDYDSFFEQEVEARRELGYPPFSRLCALRFEGPREEDVVKAATAVKSAAEKIIKAKGFDITALGPAPALVQRVKNRHRWQVLLKGKEIKALHSLVGALRAHFEARKQGVALAIDMDPATAV